MKNKTEESGSISPFTEPRNSADSFLLRPSCLVIKKGVCSDAFRYGLGFRNGGSKVHKSLNHMTKIMKLMIDLDSEH